MGTKYEVDPVSTPAESASPWSWSVRMALVPVKQVGFTEMVEYAKRVDFPWNPKTVGERYSSILQNVPASAQAAQTTQYLYSAPIRFSFTLSINDWWTRRSPDSGGEPPSYAAQRALLTADEVLARLRYMVRPLGPLMSNANGQALATMQSPKVLFLWKTQAFLAWLDNLSITHIKLDPLTHETLRAEASISLSEAVPLKGYGFVQSENSPTVLQRWVRSVLVP